MSRTTPTGSTSESETDPRRRGRSARRWHAIRALVVAVAIGMAIGTVAVGSVGAAMTDGAASTGTDATDEDAESDPVLVVADATVDPDSSATHRVSLTEAPEGLAGFKLTLAVENGDVATVANAGYPDHFELTSDPVVSADGETVTVEAADLGDEITAGATDVTLATIELTGVDDGETELRVTDLQVDADGGAAVDPTLEAGTLTVNNDSSETTDTDSGSDDNDSNGDSVPGFAIGPAVAAIAALVAIALARLR